MNILSPICDTHLHLDHEQFSADFQEVVKRATLESGVGFMINVSCDSRGIDASISLAETYEFIYAAVGWHPLYADQVSSEQLDLLREKAGANKVVAIGEIGLDYYHDGVPREVQQRVFREQIGVAQEVGLPLIIHARDSYEDVLDILRVERADKIGGVMHCFGGDHQMMEEALQLGFMIGLGGIVTFKNAALAKEIARQVPLDRLLLETDAPYLAPHPYRGKRNEPAYLYKVAEEIAILRGMPIRDLIQATTKNAVRLFRLPIEI